MGELLASKIVIQEEEPQLRAIPATSTAVIAALGVAERGPLFEPVLLTSWEDYLKNFGGYTTNGDLPLAVRGIYRQDPGAYVWAARLVHCTDVTNPATKTSAAASATVDSQATAASAGSVTGSIAGPWNLEPSDTLQIHVDADGGGPDTATFTADAGRLVGGATSLPPGAGDTVVLKCNLFSDNQTVTFAGSETTAALAAQKINESVVGMRAIVVGGTTIDLVADTRGTDSLVQVVSETGGGAGHIGHTAATQDAGSGNVADIDAVTFAEAKSIIEAACSPGVTCTEVAGCLKISSNTTGASSSVQVEVASTADDEFGLDNTLHSGSATASVPCLTVSGKTDGTYAHDLRIVIADASNGGAGYFNFLVQDDTGITLEIFPNVQNTDDTAADFVETVVNHATAGSNLVSVVDLASGIRPANGTETPAGGNDGLTSLGDTDFLGDEAGATGLHAFDLIQDARILVVPGRATSAVHNGMVDYCESTKAGSMFAILDPPSGLTAAQIKVYVETTAALKNLSEFAAIYWPRIQVLNPSKAVYGASENVTVPPSGWVAGVYSRTDRSQPGGVYQPPAGVERGVIYGCMGFETDEVLDERKRDLVYPANINPISKEPGTSRFIDGTRVLKTDGNFPSVAERRGVIYIEQSIRGGTVFARHSNNDAALRARIFRTVYQFLKNQMQLGAFRSKDPATAFFVDVSDALNPPSVQFQNKIIGRVGLATQKPADWVVFYFSQDTRALLEELGQ